MAVPVSYYYWPLPLLKYRKKAIHVCNVAFVVFFGTMFAVLRWSLQRMRCKPFGHFELADVKRKSMEWQRYIYITCKQPIFIFWNYRWDFRNFHWYRSWSSIFISSHSRSTPHTTTQKQSYAFRFMAKIIHIIPYAISTIWHKHCNSKGGNTLLHSCI